MSVAEAARKAPPGALGAFLQAVKIWLLAWLLTFQGP